MLFSIIIPTYNRSQTLSRSIDSVFKQSYKFYELIIVDDGSNDNTAQIVNSYLKDNRVIYIYQNNQGVSAARNSGAKIAKGEYILFLDSDDWVSPTWLLDYSNVIGIKNFPDLVFCDLYDIYINGIYKSRNNKKSVEAKYWNLYIPGTFAVKREIFIQSGGYDHNLKFAENTELSWRINSLVNTKGYFPAANLYHFISEEGASKNSQNILDSFFYLEDKHNIIFDNDRVLYQNFCEVAALNAFRISLLQQSKNLFIKGFLVRPLNLKALMRVIIIHSPFLRGKVWKTRS